MSDDGRLKPSPWPTPHAWFAPTRRGVLAALLGAVTQVSNASTSVDATRTRRRKRNRKTTLCYQGSTIEVRGKQTSVFLADGATRGRCTCLGPGDDIQAAIDRAQPGATVSLCAGSWQLSQPIRLTQNLTLAGEGSTLTELDGGGARRVLEIAADITVTIQNLSIVRGKSNGGGGILNSGALTVRNCQIMHNVASLGNGGGIATYPRGTLALIDSLVFGNRADVEGGGIYTLFGSVVLENSQVRNNVGQGGGGIAGGDSITLRGSDVTDNRASPGPGGGIYAQCPIVLESNCAIAGNTAEYGGGIYGTKDMHLGPGTRITSNVSATDGGGLTLGGGVTTVARGARIAGNRADRGGGAFLAGGFLEAQAGAEITRNVAITSGGGIFVQGTNVWPTLESSTIVTGNVLSDGATVSNCTPADTFTNCID